MTRGILASLFLILAGSMFFMYTKPAYDKVQTLQAQGARYDQALSKAAQLQELKQSLLARFNTFDPNDITRLQKLLPDHVDNIGLILDLNNLAAQHGMALENVDVTNSGGGVAPASAATIGAEQQNYDSLTLKFTTHSTYANFEQFLKDLEASLRIVDLTSLSIARNAVGPSSGSPVYQYQITFKTYWLK